MVLKWTEFSLAGLKLFELNSIKLKWTELNELYLMWTDLDSTVLGDTELNETEQCKLSVHTELEQTLKSVYWKLRTGRRSELWRSFLCCLTRNIPGKFPGFIPTHLHSHSSNSIQFKTEECSDRKCYPAIKADLWRSKSKTGELSLTYVTCCDQTAVCWCFHTFNLIQHVSDVSSSRPVHLTPSDPNSELEILQHVCSTCWSFHLNSFISSLMLLFHTVEVLLQTADNRLWSGDSRW